ncbi:MAG: DNA helicase [Proteobacteria bacterium]|nr:MAG: DNA helicase [Pseudomonadota bacterium]
MQLRDYQRTSIDATYNWFQRNPTGNPLLVLPTGSGKTIIAGMFTKEIMESWPNQRIVCCTHVKELISQNYETLLKIWPDAPAGIYSASFNRREESAQILFAGIQSVYNKAMHIGWADLILVDEAHLIPKKTMTGMYRVFLDAMQKINPALRIIGLTATPYRLDSGLLIEGEGAIFHDIAYEVPIGLLLERGYLSPLTTEPVRERINTKGVKKRGGDFVLSDLAKAVDKDDITRKAVAEIVELGQSRKSWIVFCASISHAENVATAIRAHGVSVELVTGKTLKRQREITLTNFKTGIIRCLVNVDVLTTGFDAPNIDLLAMLRPTQSTALYIQIMGRGMRIHPSKQDCLVLDFAGNIARHGPIDAVAPQDKDTSASIGTGEAPTRICPECGASMHASSTECADCGFIFPDKGVNHKTTASTLAALSNAVEPDCYEITDVLYSRHKKEGKPDSLRVDYYHGFRRIASEWVCVEHAGKAGSNARHWLTQRMDNDLISTLPAYPPRTVTEVLNYTDQLAKPKCLLCKQAGKFTEIVKYEWR